MLDRRIPASANGDRLESHGQSRLFALVLCLLVFPFGRVFAGTDQGEPSGVNVTQGSGAAAGDPESITSTRPDDAKAKENGLIDRASHGEAVRDARIDKLDLLALVEQWRSWRLQVHSGDFTLFEFTSSMFPREHVPADADRGQGSEAAGPTRTEVLAVIDGPLADVVSSGVGKRSAESIKAALRTLPPMLCQRIQTLWSEDCQRQDVEHVGVKHFGRLWVESCLLQDGVRTEYSSLSQTAIIRQDGSSNGQRFIEMSGLSFLPKIAVTRLVEACVAEDSDSLWTLSVAGPRMDVTFLRATSFVRQVRIYGGSQTPVVEIIQRNPFSVAGDMPMPALSARVTYYPEADDTELPHGVIKELDLRIIVNGQINLPIPDERFRMAVPSGTSVGRLGEDFKVTRVRSEVGRHGVHFKQIESYAGEVASTVLDHAVDDVVSLANALPSRSQQSEPESNLVEVPKQIDVASRNRLFVVSLTAFVLLSGFVVFRAIRSARQKP